MNEFGQTAKLIFGPNCVLYTQVQQSVHIGTYPGYTTSLYMSTYKQLTLIGESWKNPKRGTVTERVFREKIQSTETYINDTTLRSGFFPENALGDGPAFWIFSGFTDKG